MKYKEKNIDRKSCSGETRSYTTRGRNSLQAQRNWSYAAGTRQPCEGTPLTLTFAPTSILECLLENTESTCTSCFATQYTIMKSPRTQFSIQHKDKKFERIAVRYTRRRQPFTSPELLIKYQVTSQAVLGRSEIQGHEILDAVV
jgi:hypothetical protein